MAAVTFCQDGGSFFLCVWGIFSQFFSLSLFFSMIELRGEFSTGSHYMVVKKKPVLVSFSLTN